MVRSIEGSLLSRPSGIVVHRVEGIRGVDMEIAKFLVSEPLKTRQVPEDTYH